MTLILGRKRGMTQLFAEDGTVTGVTVVEAGPCVVTQVRTLEKDGYDAVQLGYEDIPDKRSRKPQLGSFRKANTAPKRFLREERLATAAAVVVGDAVKVDAFKPGSPLLDQAKMAGVHHSFVDGAHQWNQDVHGIESGCDGVRLTDYDVILIRCQPSLQLSSGRRKCVTAK